jgi:hypothetical protein
LPSPVKEDAQKSFEAWHAAISRGDFEAILHHTARLNTPKSSSNLLKNLGYDLNSLQSGTNKLEITGIYQGEIWTAIGAKVELKDKVVFPLYPIVQTPKGPKIFSEIDLFASGNRSREFLNKSNLEQLEADTSQAAADELRALLAEHQKNTDAAKSGP